MADNEQLYTALRNADAAGDTQAATRLAGYIKTLPTTHAAPTEKKENPIVSAVGGTVEPILNMATGMIAKPVGDIAGLAAVPAHAMGLTNKDPRAVQEATQKALTWSPKTQGGKSAMEAITQGKYSPISAYGKFSSAMGNVAGGEGSAFGRGTKEAFDQAPNFVGLKAAPKLGQFDIGAAAKSGFSKSPKQPAGVRAPAMATSKLATDLGMKIPPQERALGETGVVANTLRAVTDKESLAANASLHNAKKVDAMVKKDLGIPANAPLTKAALKSRLAEEGKVFESIRNIPATFASDGKYQTDIESVGTSYTDAARNYPETFGRQKADKLIDELAYLPTGEMLPSHAVDLMRMLREKSSNYMNSVEPSSREMGMVYRDAASAIEGLVERNLDALGNKSMYDDFVASREKSAKIYDALGALHEPSGSLDPGYYAALFEKNKPLSGNAEKVGRLASAYAPYFQSASTASGKITGSHRTSFGVLTEASGIQPMARKALLSSNIPWKGVK